MIFALAQIGLPSTDQTAKLGEIGGPNLVIVVFVLLFCFALVFAVFKWSVKVRDDIERHMAALPGELSKAATAVLEHDREEGRKANRELFDMHRADNERNVAGTRQVVVELIGLVRESIAAQGKTQSEVASLKAELSRLMVRGDGVADPAAR